MSCSGKAVELKTFERLAFEHREGLYSFALHQTHNRSDAEDLVQETYLRAFTRFRQFKQGTNFKAWIFTILRNTAINEFRRGLRTVAVDLESVEWQLVAPRSADAAGGFTRWDIRAALARLPREYRAPVLLFDVEGHSYAEISRIMSCPIGTVMSRIYRARRRLRADLLRAA